MLSKEYLDILKVLLMLVSSPKSEKVIHHIDIMMLIM